MPGRCLLLGQVWLPSWSSWAPRQHPAPHTWCAAWTCSISFPGACACNAMVTCDSLAVGVCIDVRQGAMIASAETTTMKALPCSICVHCVTCLLHSAHMTHRHASGPLSHFICCAPCCCSSSRCSGSAPSSGPGPSTPMSWQPRCACLATWRPPPPAQQHLPRDPQAPSLMALRSPGRQGQGPCCWCHLRMAG